MNITKIMLAGLLLSLPLPAFADWYTAHTSPSSITLINSEVLLDGGHPRLHVMDMRWEYMTLSEDMEKNVAPDIKKMTSTEAFWTVDCKGMRIKSERTMFQHPLGAEWEHEDNTEWTTFSEDMIDEEPLLSYACRPPTERERWETVQDARDAKWPEVVAWLPEYLKELEKW